MSKHSRGLRPAPAAGPQQGNSGAWPRAAGAHAGRPFSSLSVPIPDTGALVTAACFILIALLSVHNHFIQDDGFITLRYVDHFLRGHGPVWYPGSDEFGYTNFLFMLLVTGVSLSGLEPVVAASVVSYAGFFTAVAATYLIATRLTGGNRVVAAVTVAVIFCNFTVSSYASGLLETSLQLAFVLLTYLSALAFAQRPGAVRHLHLATAAGTLGLLTRLDTILLVAPAFLFLFHRIWRVGDRRGRAVAHMAAALAIAAAVMSAFLVFCYLFYGQILPTTFYLKAGLNVEFGLQYLRSFMTEEMLVYPYLFGIILLHWYRTEGRLPRLRNAGGYELALAAAILCWVCYVIYVGGCFMGFRLMIPFIAIFMLLAFTTMGKRFGAGFAMQIAVIALATQIGQYFFFSRLDHSLDRVIETPSGLHWTTTREHSGSRTVGRRLNELFYTGDASDVMIAVRGAGATPYYSRLPTFDMHGLNTRDVALNGVIAGTRPGHRRWTTMGQMERVGVNLIVTEGYCFSDLGDLEHPLPFLVYTQDLPTVLIPLPTEGCWALTYYMQPHPDIDRRIDDGTFVVIGAT